MATFWLHSAAPGGGVPGWGQNAHISLFLPSPRRQRTQSIFPFPTMSHGHSCRFPRPFWALPEARPLSAIRASRQPVLLTFSGNPFRPTRSQPCLLELRMGLCLQLPSGHVTPLGIVLRHPSPSILSSREPEAGGPPESRPALLFLSSLLLQSAAEASGF